MEQHNSCEEGGHCQYRTPKSVGCCGWTYRLCCCPCWVLFSCALSQGAAGASMQGLHGGEDGGEMTCFKCGLSPAESKALNEAKSAEMRGVPTGHAPHYFNNSMTLPTTPSPTSSHYPPHSPIPSASAEPEPRSFALRSQVQRSLAPPSPNPSTRRSQEGNPAVAWVEEQRRSQMSEGR
ncbi:hypothetical protein BCR35DRAFT_306102 [Leucosporidium creatinivorum]|uniref:Uncharacterized protein n=1 Tax=Leucosporidium creatinivorum TaxID=106004 RepID=A0A1Y2EWV1_9BASI|nr:hypothetical protein BCR35DRAFT_306102 [Leucosporidium creatinivorum]